MKSLTQKEILSWNHRKFSIKSLSNYIGQLKFNYKTNYQNYDIVIAQFIFDNPYTNHEFGSTQSPLNNPLNNNENKIIKEVYIKYDFCFSVVKNHNEDFFSLLDKTFKKKLTFEYYVSEKDTKDLIFDKNVLSNIKEMSYFISDIEFTRYQYTFDGDLFSIMAYISYLEETIDSFNLLYGYDENGKEINLLKFPIGTIVTEGNNTDKDFLVIDYNFYKRVDDIYISYVTTEILYTNKPVIKYGEIYEFYEKDLVISRNGRIDKILN